MNAKQLHDFNKRAPGANIVIDASLDDGAHETMLLPVNAVEIGYYDEWGEIEPPADPDAEKVVFIDVGFGKGLVFDMHEPVHAYHQTLRKLP